MWKLLIREPVNSNACTKPWLHKITSLNFRRSFSLLVSSQLGMSKRNFCSPAEEEEEEERECYGDQSVLLLATAPKIDTLNSRTQLISFFYVAHFITVHTPHNLSASPWQAKWWNAGEFYFDILRLPDIHSTWCQTQRLKTTPFHSKTLIERWCVDIIVCQLLRVSHLPVMPPCRCWLLHIILVIKWNDFVSRKNIPVSIIEQKVCQRKVDETQAR